MFFSFLFFEVVKLDYIFFRLGNEWSCFVHSILLRITYTGDYIKKSNENAIFLKRGGEWMRGNGSEDKNWKRDEEMVSFTKEEKQLITYIKEKTAIANMDNISRTRTYQQYYLRNKEVEWSFFSEYGFEKCWLEYDRFRRRKLLEYPI